MTCSVATDSELHGHARQVQKCQWAFAIMSVSSWPESTYTSSFPHSVYLSESFSGCKGSCVGSHRHRGGGPVSQEQGERCLAGLGTFPWTHCRMPSRLWELELDGRLVKANVSTMPPLKLKGDDDSKIRLMTISVSKLQTNLSLKHWARPVDEVTFKAPSSP